jgi:hypothetical protein
LLIETSESPVPSEFYSQPSLPWAQLKPSPTCFTKIRKNDIKNAAKSGCLNVLPEDGEGREHLDYKRQLPVKSIPNWLSKIK